MLSTRNPGEKFPIKKIMYLKTVLKYQIYIHLQLHVQIGHWEAAVGLRQLVQKYFYIIYLIFLQKKNHGL